MFLPHRFEFKIDADTRAWFREFSDKTGRSQGELVREAMAIFRSMSENQNETPMNRGS